MSGLELLPRSAWNARPRRHHPGILEADEVHGLAFHWPGTTSSRPLSREAVPRALRSWQDFHMDTHGWSDIAYQVAVDQWGRAWELRGLANRSAANGDTRTNSTHGAVLLVLVQNEEPTPAMVATVREVVAEFRRLFPHGEQLAGHGDVRTAAGLPWTDCPGPAVRRRLRMDQFNPRKVDEMAQYADQLDTIERLTRETRKAVGSLRGKEARRFRELIRESRQAGRTADETLEAVDQLAAELEDADA